MSIFNTVGAGLNIRDKGSRVSTESYALVATDLALICFQLFGFRKNMKELAKLSSGTQMGKFKLNVAKHGKFMTRHSLITYLIYIINIAYSALVIQYSLSNTPIDDMLYNFSLAVVVLNVVAMLSGYILIVSFFHQIMLQVKDQLKQEAIGSST